MATSESTGEAVVRVLLVNDRAVGREGLRAMLILYDDVDVVGDAEDSTAAIELARSLSPDVALVDVNISGLDGFEIASRLREVSPVTRVAIISAAFDSQAINRGLAAGVHGFILKSESHERLAAFVCAIARGAFCCSESIREALSFGPDNLRVVRWEDPRLQLLTAREREMLVELAKGASLKNAARAIGISYKAADHLKQSVMKKLNIHDRVEITRFAIHEGLID